MNTQRQIINSLLKKHNIMRATEIKQHGVTANTISRMVNSGEITRLSRGIYQLPDSELTISHDLAEVSKRIPKAIICLTSALSYYELTDQLPRKVWIALREKDWQPVGMEKNVNIVRFADDFMAQGYEVHDIEGVQVKIFGIARTIADSFKFRNKIGINVAIGALKEAIRKNMVNPSEIIEHAKFRKVYSIIKPYLEAVITDG